MWAVATLTLVAGLIDDMRSQKVHNALVIVLFATALAANFMFRDGNGLVLGGLALVAAMAMAIPLFVLGVVGGGDVKLFAVFALCVDPYTAFWTLVYSIVWGGIFGLTRATLQKEILVLVRNTCKLARRQKLHVQELHKIPYTFALLLGWFTQLTLMRAGLSL
jgi:prepilin peptidase CpaA